MITSHTLVESKILVITNVLADNFQPLAKAPVIMIKLVFTLEELKPKPLSNYCL